MRRKKGTVGIRITDCGDAEANQNAVFDRQEGIVIEGAKGDVTANRNVVASGRWHSDPVVKGILIAVVAAVVAGIVLAALPIAVHHFFPTLKLN